MNRRELHSHTITHEEHRLRVYALGERGPNGDNHAYLVQGANQDHHPLLSELNDFAEAMPDAESDVSTVILFQQGNPAQAVNGYTLEVLLAIAYDRLNSCQSGPYASEHNAQAMIHINYALEHLHDRTRENLAAAEVPLAQEEAAQAARDNDLSELEAEEAMQAEREAQDARDLEDLYKEKGDE